MGVSHSNRESENLLPISSIRDLRSTAFQNLINLCLMSVPPLSGSMLMLKMSQKRQDARDACWLVYIDIIVKQSTSQKFQNLTDRAQKLELLLQFLTRTSIIQAIITQLTFTANNRNIRKRCEECSMLTIKTPERHHSNIVVVFSC